MLTKCDKIRICDKALQLNIQHQKGEITLKEQDDNYWQFIKELEEININSFFHDVEVLNEAFHDLFIEFCKSLKIDKFLDTVEKVILTNVQQCVINGWRRIEHE